MINNIYETKGDRVNFAFATCVVNKADDLVRDNIKNGWDNINDMTAIENRYWKEIKTTCDPKFDPNRKIFSKSKIDGTIIMVRAYLRQFIIRTVFDELIPEREYIERRKYIMPDGQHMIYLDNSGWIPIPDK